MLRRLSLRVLLSLLALNTHPDGQDNARKLSISPLGSGREPSFAVLDVMSPEPRTGEGVYVGYALAAMDTYDEVVGILSDCGSRERALFTCACAERAFPVVRVLTSPQSSYFCREALDMAWRSITTRETLSEIEDELAALPEASIDDSNDPRYYAMRAIGLVADALRASDETDNPAVSAAGGALDLAGDIAEVSGESDLLELEGKVQIQTLRALLADDSPTTIERIRQLGVSVSAAYERAATILVNASRLR